MDSKKHVFKIVPGKGVFNKTGLQIFQDSVNGENLTWSNLKKIVCISLDGEEDKVLNLPIKFCNATTDGSLILAKCIKENGEDLKKASYQCDKKEGQITNCKFPVMPFRNAKLDYENNSHSFVYLNDKLMKTSIDYESSNLPFFTTKVFIKNNCDSRSIMQSLSDSVEKISKAKFLIALNETDLLMFFFSLLFCALNVSSSSSIMILSRLLMKIVDQKSCLIVSILFSHLYPILKFQIS